MVSPLSGTSPLGDGVQGRLSFNLPEMLDGIMCSISLSNGDRVSCGGRVRHGEKVSKQREKVSGNHAAD